MIYNLSIQVHNFASRDSLSTQSYINNLPILRSTNVNRSNETKLSLTKKNVSSRWYHVETITEEE